ncbi:hypothetical protein GCM10010398_32440 [Streptomyces fimbriatus]
MASGSRPASRSERSLRRAPGSGGRPDRPASARERGCHLYGQGRRRRQRGGDGRAGSGREVPEAAAVAAEGGDDPAASVGVTGSFEGEGEEK